MIWRKRKVESRASANTPSLFELAEKLGVERRHNIRVRYPREGSVCGLPEVAFNGDYVLVQDISVGGCCLLDPRELLGSNVGADIVLELTWPGQGAISVCSRLVGRVDHRRHIQFLDLHDERRQQIRDAMSPGLRGVSMQKSFSGEEAHVQFSGAEFWSSIQGDSLVILDDVHRQATLWLENQEFSLWRGAWPTLGRSVERPCSIGQVEQLTLFLANVKGSSERLKNLCRELGEIWTRQKAYETKP